MGGSCLLFYAGQAKPVGWELLLVTVQPLANVITNYTCQHGNKKREYVVQDTHPLPLEGVAAHTA